MSTQILEKKAMVEAASEACFQLLRELSLQDVKAEIARHKTSSAKLNTIGRDIDEATSTLYRKVEEMEDVISSFFSDGADGLLEKIGYVVSYQQACLMPLLADALETIIRSSSDADLRVKLLNATERLREMRIMDPAHFSPLEVMVYLKR